MFFMTFFMEQTFASQQTMPSKSFCGKFHYFHLLKWKKKRKLLLVFFKGAKKMLSFVLISCYDKLLHISMCMYSKYDPKLSERIK